jgi:hypothetical protein
MKTTTILATVGLLAIAIAVTPPAAAQPGPECMPVYQEHHLGPISIIRPNSCEAYIVYNGPHPCDDWNPAIC